MATIKHYKVVAALPGTLEADALYLVRVGSGFDLYATNGSGTVVAYAANYQAASANLTALAGLTGANNKAPYFTAAGAMAVYDLTVFGRSLAASADNAAARSTLGLGTAATRDATTSASDTTSERLWRTNDLVKQTSATDATSGRVLLTNAFGNGAMALNSTNLLTDLNDINIPSGLYAYAANTNGAPNASPGIVEIRRFANAVTWQQARTVNGVAASNLVYDRQVRVGPVYEAWQLFTTISQTVQDTGWNTPTLLNSWANESGNPFRYRLRHGVLEFCGRCTNATANNFTTAFTLPAGYRPNKQLTLHAGGNTYGGNTALIYISTAGVVVLYDTSTQGTTATIDADGVRCLLDY